MSRGTPGPLDPIPGNTVIDIRNWGSTDTDATDAIDAALNAAAGEGGGVVQLPPETITSTGGHVIPEGVEVRGFGDVSVITHTGNNTLFSCHTGTINNRCGVTGFIANGNSGASAIGISYGDQWGFRFQNVAFQGYTAGIGVQAQNTTHWTEGTEARGLRIRNCAIGLEFTRSVSSPYDSFGYTDMRGIAINVPASGIGIKMGNTTGALESLIYNSKISAIMWLDDNATGILATTNGTFTGEVWITGEKESGATGTTFVDCDGSFLYTGQFFNYPDTFDTTFTGTDPPVKRLMVGDSTMTSLEPVISGGLEPGTQSFAGMTAVTDTNQACLVAWGYDFGDNAVFRVASRPFTANATARWDATGQVAFEVLADGGILCNGNYVQFGNGVFWYSASGSPEGVVTAPIGSLYTRTDGGATTTLYVKTSGTGNTGWTAK